MRRYLLLPLLSAGIMSLTAITGAVGAIVNVDFNGIRDAETPGLTYSGVGRVGTGTVFNGITVVQDIATIPATPLVTDAGGISGLTLSSTVTAVQGGNSGGDNPGNAATTTTIDPMTMLPVPDPTNAQALYGDYLFTTGGNAVTLNLSGFVDNTAVTLYVYHGAASGIVPSGGTSFTGAVDNGATGIFANRTFVYTGTATANGSISILVSGGINIINGLTVSGDTVVPEPASLGVLGLASVGLLARRRCCLA